MFSVSVCCRGLIFTSPFPWRIGIVGFMAFPELLKGEAEEMENALKRLSEDPFFQVHELGPMSRELWVKACKIFNGKTLVRCLQPDILGQRLDIGSRSRSERRKAVNYIISEMEKAAELGLKTIAICGGSDPGPDRREEAFRNTLDSLRRICRSAAKMKLNVAFEAFDREYDRRLLTGPAEETAALLREVRQSYKNIGLLWDLSHAPMLQETPQVLERVKDVLVHIHIGCAKRVNKGLIDSHPVFYTPGAVNGVEEVAELLKVLYKIGYSGAVSFEVKPEPQQTSLEIINTAKGVLITAYYRALESILGII